MATPREAFAIQAVKIDSSIRQFSRELRDLEAQANTLIGQAKDLTAKAQSLEPTSPDAGVIKTNLHNAREALASALDRFAHAQWRMERLIDTNAQHAKEERTIVH